MKRIRNISVSLVAALLFAVLCPLQAHAQADVAYDTFSPYSMYGIGNLETLGSQNSLAMGGIAIGDRSSSYINWVNPAAVTARENRAFMLDFGVTHKDIIYTADASTSIETTDSGKLRSANNLTNIHHIIVSLPIGTKVAVKAGLMPFSATGYQFVSREYADDVLLQMGNVNYQKAGKGGIYQIVLGAGWQIIPNLSIGVDGLYYMGNTLHTSSTNFTTNSHYRQIARSWTSVSRGLGAKAGVQYTANLKKDLALTLGATYKIGSTMGGTYTDLLTASSSNQLDTINVSRTPIDIKIPAEIGAGFTLRKTDKWMFGADYTLQDWSNTVFTNSPGINVTTRMAQSFRIGGELIPDKYAFRYYLKNVTYRGGLYYNLGYIAVNNTPINSYGITFGASFPVFNRFTSLALSVDLGRMGTLANNLVLENYVKVNVGLNLFDLWFHKSLYK
ncbi:MAG: hypothetical protein J6X89_04650 [Bacteroidales bacterium]|nr:hypothetical protein [Bacteroidales bacterium]